MADQNQSKPTQTQAKRRLKYGLNVVVAVVAAAALAVLINWLAYREYVRLDMTAGGRYSLSAQTEQVLGRLEQPHQITTLFRASNEHLERVMDLVEEYGRYSTNLDVQHINPDLDVARRNTFYKDLLQRYEDQVQPVADAVETARQRHQKAMEQLAGMLPKLRQINSTGQVGDQQLSQFLKKLTTALGRQQRQSETRAENLDEMLDHALPNYSGAKSQLSSDLQWLDQTLLAQAITQFERAANTQNVPAGVQNTLLSLADQMKQTKRQVSQARSALDDTDALERYKAVRTDLLESQAVVIMGPKRVNVIAATDLYRQATQNRAAQSAQTEPNLQFLGEEKITGALVSLQLEQPPMVCFIYTGQRPALGRRGQYTQVAERLRSTSFDVEQWNPTGGGRSRMQRMRGGGNSQPPEPEPGQEVIWIVLPSQQPQNPMAAMQGGGGGKRRIAQHLQQRMAQGDNAMFILSMNPMSGMMGRGNTDPLTQMLNTWGIEPQLDRLILREVQQPNRGPTASNLHQVKEWSDELPITKALSGMPAAFLQTSPIKLNESDEMQVQHWPLVRITGDRVWAETDLQQQNPMRNATYDQANSADSFTVGVAAESNDKRLIAVADPRWATDTLTRLGNLGAGTAAITGARFPGNSELFVNSVYWLGGLDELIAASPRTQDIRRIEPLSDTELAAYRWSLLLGMPVLVLLVGLGVWLVRRRG